MGIFSFFRRKKAADEEAGAAGLGPEAAGAYETFSGLDSGGPGAGVGGGAGGGALGGFGAGAGGFQGADVGRDYLRPQAFVDKDFQIILAKLETISLKLDNLNQRLEAVERYLQGQTEQQAFPKRRW